MISEPTLAALLGGVVGFGGAGLLQQARFHREDLRDLRERFGIAKALLADLHQAQSQVATAIEDRQMVRHSRFPVATWRLLAHRLIGALHDDAGLLLVNAFSRLEMANDLLAAYPQPTIELSANSDLSDGFNALQEQLVAAIAVLDQLVAEYGGREEEMRQPALTRLRRRLLAGRAERSA